MPTPAAPFSRPPQDKAAQPHSQAIQEVIKMLLAVSPHPEDTRLLFARQQKAGTDIAAVLAKQLCLHGYIKALEVPATTIKLKKTPPELPLAFTAAYEAIQASAAVTQEPAITMPSNSPHSEVEVDPTALIRTHKVAVLTAAANGVRAPSMSDVQIDAKLLVDLRKLGLVDDSTGVDVPLTDAQITGLINNSERWLTPDFSEMLSGAFAKSLKAKA